jgi:hypothetical protein
MLSVKVIVLKINIIIAVSSKSGEEALEESDSDICVEEPSSDNRHIR